MRRPCFEHLEARELLAAVSVNAGQAIRSVDTQLLGVNLVNWDSDLNTAETQQMVEAAGLTTFRFPGGSTSDDFHFNSPASYNGAGTDSSMGSFIGSVNGQGIITLDYGSGSPQEAAAMLAYFDGSINNTTVIGNGQEWSDSANAWQTVNWNTVGYWASLRRQAALAQDDGLNFLRLDHAAPFGFQFWEVGNEEYGSWEIDHHAAQHDPATYIAFAKQFATYAAEISPGISIGLDVGSPGSDYNSWTADILQQSVAQGFMPGFLSDHNYVQAPGSESDSTLLLDTTTGTNSDPSDPGNPYDWSQRSTDYENLLTKYLGTAGGNVQLIATEFNSVYTNPGKQTTSLVNGIWLADSLGALLETPYNGADVWDLRNYYDNSNNNSSSLYGWRGAGDYGIIGSPNGSPPYSGTYVPYPTYFAEQLGSKIIKAGGEVVQASSSDPNLTTYAVLEANGQLELLVINKSAAGALTGQFQLTNFQPSAQATLWQYGEAQDTAQSQSTTGASALANSATTLTLSGSSFSDSFPAYSMSVLVLSPAATSGPTFVNPASATPSPVMGKSTALSALASDPAGASSLTYTWMATGTPPASVSFSANGTNAAQSTTATFSRAGSYSFQVTAKDPSGLTATSGVTVLVNQTATTLLVSPGSVTVPEDQTESFTALVYDQFGNALTTQPGLTWSVASGAGTIGAGSGIYTAPNVAGTAVVQATGDGVSGTAVVTISLPSSGVSGRFLGSNTTTEGSWIGTYGAQGYDVIGGASSLPSYATIAPSGQSTYVWSTTTTSPVALQEPGSTGRIAACWYSPTGFTVDVNLTDTNAHDLELYFLDYDHEGRGEQVQLSNATTGAVLDTETISSFTSGVYLKWAVSGNFLIRITRTSGINAALSGLFLDPPPAPSATFLGRDTTTEGTWIGTYGAQGYDVIGGASSLPSYATIAPSGQSTYVWSTTTTSPVALQEPGGTSRIAACWYLPTSFTVDVNLTDGNAHDLELYFLDYDNKGRSEQVQLSNVATGAVLDTETISSFTSGVYLKWAVSGNFLITITRTAGINAVLSGLFIDLPPAPSATFLARDATTEGSWIGTYGVQGYDVIGGASSLPSYATIAPSGQSTYVWSTTTTSPVALQEPGSTARVAACWYSPTSFTVDVNLTDGNTHDLELYFLDYDNKARGEQVQLSSAATGAVLDTETVSSFTSGVYLKWAVSGNVLITITRTAGINAVLSGLFLDPATKSSDVIIKRSGGHEVRASGVLDIDELGTFDFAGIESQANPALGLVNSADDAVAPTDRGSRIGAAGPKRGRS